jgi:hypothetical protein
MSLAAVTPIEVQPIQIPVYRNERIRSFAAWLADNDHALTEYFNALKPYAAEGVEPLVDYFEFVALAHEREEMKLMSERLPHGAGAL